MATATEPVSIAQAAGTLAVQIRNIDSLRWLQTRQEFAQAQDRKVELRAAYALLVEQHTR